MKEFFLTVNLNLLWPNLRPFPLILSIGALEKRLTPTSLHKLTSFCHRIYKNSSGISDTGHSQIFKSLKGQVLLPHSLKASEQPGPAASSCNSSPCLHMEALSKQSHMILTDGESHDSPVGTKNMALRFFSLFSSRKTLENY